ncbi:hypothetical protein [Marinilabilia salmonicolor]|uniref:HNH endonuclease n=1 Tax=Marinilabilia salmonicolor TaxID=989 RepID=A0A368UIR1_9BACT|nr:hypothetical protein [Marinilabilia salmonicolor]RCW19726.1 hypothetical protein DFO77_1743 [Marinilabilia salmonicolor]
MSKNRKQILFEKFSGQLHLLKENNLIDIDLKYEKTYICPLCLNQFSENDLVPDKTKNYLTEEDAPPAALGGSRIALTCKKCNSECGHKIDYQLKKLIEHEENSRFIKGTIQRGTIEHEGKQVTVEMTSEGNGVLKAAHDEKRNNPTLFKKFIAKVKKGKLLDFKPKSHRLDNNKINYAFYKTNYIITFSKFGYIFLLDNAYDSLREQILNPETELIKYNFAIHNPHLSNHIGTHYILDNEIKAVFNIFNLKSKLSEKAYGAFLPIPNITFAKFVEEMGKKIVNNVAGFNKSEYDEDIDLFADINEINKIFNWINNRN